MTYNSNNQTHNKCKAQNPPPPYTEREGYSADKVYADKYFLEKFLAYDLSAYAETIRVHTIGSKPRTDSIQLLHALRILKASRVLEEKPAEARKFLQWIEESTALALSLKDDDGSAQRKAEADHINNIVARMRYHIERLVGKERFGIFWHRMSYCLGLPDEMMFKVAQCLET
ncbi:hypothetical protein C8Q75DRAFT_805060 [Abortiporus biennis]|nr:hypothetical protein C8Q75DRAFT_805060 [Abortiporus biennis]